MARNRLDPETMERMADSIVKATMLLTGDEADTATVLATAMLKLLAFSGCPEENFELLVGTMREMLAEGVGPVPAPPGVGGGVN